MKILITGAKGVLGSALARAAKEEGLQLLPMDRDALDITDAGAVVRAVSDFRPDAIVNCAAYSNVDGAQAAPEEALSVNRDGARNLAVAASQVDAHFTHISTDYVFDGKKSTPYLPADQPAPLNLYGISKLVGEGAVREANPKALILRTSWIFGEVGRGFVAWVRETLSAEGPPLKIVEDERSRPTWSDDLARATLELVQENATGCHHLANQGECTRLELAQGIRTILKAHRELIGVTSETFGAPARRPAYSVLDLTATEAVLGRSLPPWQDSLRRYLDS
jgi:dTDP-4-dehydrorhamnose reductase